MEATEHVFEKFGPTIGVVFIVGIALLGLIFIVIPKLIDRLALSLDRIANAVIKMAKTTNRAAKRHEINAVKRHTVVVGKIDALHGDVVERLDKMRDKLGQLREQDGGDETTE